MATDTETQSPEQLHRLANELGLSPADLASLPDWIKLAKELGMDLKDLLDNKNTSAISIVNNTKHPLYFMNEHDRVSGAFRTLPPNEIAPGATGTFLSGETQRSILTGDDAKITYAVGAPEFCQWTLHWDNPEKGENSADQQIVYPQGQDRPDGTHIQYWGVEEFARTGSVLTPFQFVIREEGFGGGADGVVDRNSCVVTVINHTKQSLFLNETHSDDGDFMSFPDDEVPAGGQTTFTVSEKIRPDHRREGVSGYARFTVTQDPSLCMWTVFWSNPEQGENIANDRLDGSDTAHYQRGPAEIPRDTKENAPVRFVLRDAGGGGGHQEHPVTEQPPPEADEPTLRLGDKSVDGWVEYLQQLLNSWSYGPLVVDGDFGHATQQAVLNFQAANGLMHDGVVGYQTWAALRQEDARPPSTDGREPHTYVEQGPEARWLTEDSGVQYGSGDDTLYIQAYNTGNVAIAPGQFTATVNLTSSTDGHVVQLHLTSFTNDGQAAAPGAMFYFGVQNVTHEAGHGHWTVFAWMPAELGGDEINGEVTLGQ